MLTTGFKAFAAWAVGFLVAAVVFGYTTGGSSVGPLSVGWKGAVGNHVGYAILLVAAAVMATLAGIIIAFRDADSDAAAGYLRVAEAPIGQRLTQPSFWPLVAAFAVGVTLVGLVVTPVLFVAGLVLLSISTIEWTMTAWADAATGDPEVNRALRDRIMGPIETPILGFGAVGILVLAISRILIAVSAEAAVWVAIGVAALIFFTAVAIAVRPNVPRNAVVAVCLLGGIGILAGGVIAGAVGERDFEHHEAEGEEHSESGDSQPGDTEEPQVEAETSE